MFRYLQENESLTKAALSIRSDRKSLHTKKIIQNQSVGADEKFNFFISPEATVASVP